jgi:hypothetical protein
MTARLVLAIILLGLVGTGVGPLAVEAAPHEVSGKGHVTTSLFRSKFQFSARGGPSQASGSMRLVTSFQGNVGPSDEGTVTCLKVQGDRMVIAGRLTAGSLAAWAVATRPIPAGCSSAWALAAGRAGAEPGRALLARGLRLDLWLLIVHLSL